MQRTAYNNSLDQKSLKKANQTLKPSTEFFMHIRTALVLTAVITLAGCASVQKSYDGYDASKVDQYIIPNQTTLAEARAYLGTPTLTAVAVEDNSKVVGWTLAGHNSAGAFMRAWGKNLATAGLGAKSHEFTVKSILVKLNDRDIVTEYKKYGASYITKSRFSLWNECERELTDEEINSPVVYRISEVCPKYAAEIAAKEGIKPEEVDIEKEFKHCNLPCQTARGALKHFGKLKNFTALVDEEEGDGSKFIFK